MAPLEEYMLPCLNKKLFGLECMGCGIQRSIALILQGDFVAAFHMYPAIYTLILLIGFALLNSFKNYKFASKIIITLAIINVIIIVGNFILKHF
ncbi:DUF2752 domain-containing protein [uncultured Psychroserpens sp.]|uniref:DUF2752 domain-containing protein n=1 Tax=uncultured Psychroserpens sp. TaxID=255436 RepID=UPI00260B4F07|nr:DUF2752 domain-containing protein [uncultured Psychroserpens sp.]